MSNRKKRTASRGRSQGRKPTNKRGTTKGTTSTYATVGIGILIVLAVVIWYGNRPDAASSVLQGRVETYASEGNDHVPIGESVDYKTNPPQSGPHYEQTAGSGFYEQSIPDPVLVHNLEHGHVIVFYKPDALTASDESYLTTLTKSYTGHWASVLAVPRTDMEHPFVLAAWRHLLRLDRLEKESVEAFIDAYVGRGPEHPVR